MTKMNPCKCGGEVMLGCNCGQWYVICKDCEGFWPLYLAHDRYEAIKEWNEIISANKVKSWREK